MIGFMGWKPGEFEAAVDELNAFVAFFEDPESDIDLILEVEEFFGVTDAVL
ncbi:hypothetical protein [Streptomyces phage phiScoe23]|nr:hypothetical protein [Streptomyces phage phiScoe23]